jgi:hypothetical protein
MVLEDRSGLWPIGSENITARRYMKDQKNAYIGGQSTTDKNGDDQAIKGSIWKIAESGNGADCDANAAKEQAQYDTGDKGLMAAHSSSSFCSSHQFMPCD